MLVLTLLLLQDREGDKYSKDCDDVEITESMRLEMEYNSDRAW